MKCMNNLFSIAAAILLAGCGGFSGLDANSSFSCSAPDGVTCMSVSGVYANAKANNLPGQRTSNKQIGKNGKTNKTSSISEYPYKTLKSSPRDMVAPSSGMPLRTKERILRVWLAPFEDNEGALHDQKYFYVTVNHGQWTIEANRLNIRNRFQQITPLSKNNPANKVEPMPAASPQQQALQTLPFNSVQQENEEE